MRITKSVTFVLKIEHECSKKKKKKNTNKELITDRK